MKAQNFEKAAEHLHRGVDMLTRLYGPDSQRLMQVNATLGELYLRTGQLPLAWKAFEFSLKNKYGQMDAKASRHALYAQSLARAASLHARWKRRWRARA